MIESSGDVLLEACVENLDQALLAEQKNADRIELCGRLDLGGITPSRDMIISSVRHLRIPAKIMIRPRGGNFIYSDSEVELMISDIIFCKENGVGEIVLGTLTDRGEVDVPLISSLSSLADPMKVTFHKAIDDVNDYMRSLEELSTLKTIESVLTSGTRKNAILGKPLLKNAIEIFSDTLSIIAAGSITNENLEKVHKEIGAKEYHGKRIVGDLIS